MSESARTSEASTAVRRPVKHLRFVTIGVLALLIGIALRLHPGWTIRDLITAISQLPVVLFVGAFAILPLLGVPVSWFLVAVGVRYNLAGGMLLTAVCMGLHNLIAYGLANSWFRTRVQQYLVDRNRRLPDIPDRHQSWFMVVFATVPGLPYAMKLYAIALTNMPFRKFFWLGWPTYVASSIVFIGLGDAAADMNGPLAIGLGICLLAGFALTWRLRRITSQSVLDCDGQATADQRRTIDKSVCRNTA